MTERRKRWYGEGLGPRIDALEVALRACEEGEPNATQILQGLLQSLRASSQTYGYTSVFEAARSAEEAPPAELAGRVRDLIRILRREIAGRQPPAATILIVGGDRGFVDELVQKFDQPGRQALVAATARDAEQLLVEKEIVFIVMDLFLPDQDGRQFIATLRSRPVTATIPIVALAARVSGESRDQNLVLDADAYFRKPASPQAVTEFVNSHLRRAHEVIRAAHRDPLTGLLNRAAFCEAYERVMRIYDPEKEPVALALVEVDGLKDADGERGSALSDAVLRHVGGVLSSSLRATDIVARWGVETFVALFPGEDQFGATRAVQKIGANLRQRVLTMADGRRLDVTVSIGVAVVPGRLAVEEAAERADHYLFAAKTAGGNRIVSSESAEDRRPERLMLFAADRNMARLMKQLMERGGFDVTVSDQGGEAAVDALHGGHYALVLIEETLTGGAAGLELLERLRGLAQFDRVPIVVLASSEAAAVRALELGANDYFVRPFAPAAFVLRLRRLLAHGRTRERGPRRPTALVVDGAVPALIVAGTALARLGGFRVLLARGADEARARLGEGPPDVALLDVAMPEGWTGVRTLLRSLDPTRTAVILSAAAGRAEEARQAGVAGVRGVIAKPFNAQSLPQEVRTLARIAAAVAPASDADEAHLNAEMQRLVKPPA
jgi:diguanylate cyclase (GGDEF)-like protein